MTIRALLVVLLTFATFPTVSAAQDEFFEDDDWDEESDEEAEDEPSGDWESEFDEEQELSGEDELPEMGELPDEEEEESRDTPWWRAYRLPNTFFGPVGGIRIPDARPGGIDSFRVQLVTEFFNVGDFLVEGDSHEHIGGAMAFSWTVHELVEVYASLAGFSDTNDRGNPQLFQVVGDLALGSKVGLPINDWLTLGADLFLDLPTSGDLGVALSSMGGTLRGLATADLRGLDDPFPLIGRFSLGYRVDNSENLVEDTEAARYAGLADPFPEADEDRHLVTARERFGIGINRTDFIDIGIGAEAPIEALEDFFISPLVEWRWGIPVNRAGFDCLFLPRSPASDEAADGQDNCLDNEGPAAFPMSLTFGLRVLPPVDGLSTLIAIDVGLTGVGRDDFVRELAANAPWNFMIGLGYAFDLRPDPEPEVIEREVPVEVEVQEEAPPRGHIRGLVREQESGNPIPNARVHIVARSETDQITGPDGRFISDAYDPGEQLEYEVTHPDMITGNCEGAIPDDASDMEIFCELRQPPQNVIVEETEVQILEKIQFELDSAEIRQQSFDLMQEIATVLIDNPQLTRIEIQGHTDNSGAAAYNLRLSQARAESVRAWLVEHGVAEARLEAQGYGLTQPLVPNDSRENRARNRRVQFIIQARSDRAPSE